MYAPLYKLVVALIVSALIANAPICEGKRTLGNSHRKTPGSSYTTRRQPNTSVTKATYDTHSAGGNSHADVAKLSYPNYNSQPNRPANVPTSNNQPIGWNVPNQGNPGPPPSYSQANVAGGAKTNLHEAPPVYQNPNYGGAPPSYNHAVGNNNGAPPQYHNQPNYYNNPSYAQGGAYPGNYHAGGMPAGGYYPQQNLPQDARYLPPGSSIPQNAILLSAPPQQTSSGPGFGTGLVAGALGGALLGHALTPTQTRVIEQAPAAAGGSSDGGHDRIIIINNGQPVNATDANGVTVINNGASPAPAVAAGAIPAPLAPLAPGPAVTDMTQNATLQVETPVMPPLANGSPAPPNPEQPPANGIICVPVHFNETDPNDATKMIVVEKTACYPAPPPQPVQPVDNAAVTPVGGSASLAPMQPITSAEGSAPLAPMQSVTPGASSQHLQQESTPIGDQTIKSANNAAGLKDKGLTAVICFVVSYLIAYNN